MSKKCFECDGTGVYTFPEEEWSSSNEQARGAPCPECGGTGEVDDDD